jgi:hypothetical protein
MIISSKPLADPLVNALSLYTLDSGQDLGDLKTLWQTVQKAKAKGHRFLNVAMRRFSDSNDRHHVEDRVIDLMIAAEALSQASGSNNKSKVMATRIASHFPKTEQRKVEGDMCETYRLRNKIMHDGDASKWLKRQGMQMKDLILFVNTSEHHLRRALRKTMEEIQ